MAALIPVPFGAEGVLPFPDPLFLFFPPFFFPPFLFFLFFFFIKSLPKLGSTSIAMTSRVANMRRRNVFEGILAW